jgi:uncharacterized protein YecE (DUF72 family)
VLTADCGYLRLRKLTYTKTDIARWAEIIGAHRRKTKDIFVYFKHEETGTGPKFARQLLDSLGHAK